MITDGQEGEDEALTNIYDLILLDVMLPNKNGFDILKTIRKEKRYGLGLAIAKSIVEKYNGKIEVLYNKGLNIFKVSIPTMQKI